MRRLLLALLLVLLGATPLWAATDDFTRANSGDLGANWDSGYSGGGALQIVSNAVRATTLATTAYETYNVAQPNDQFAEVTITTWNIGATHCEAYVLVRWAAPTADTGYLFVVSDLEASLYEVTTGTFTLLDFVPGGLPIANGSVIRIEANGTTIRGLHNGVEQLSATDSAHASGRPGIRIYNDSGNLANVVLDAFNTGGPSAGAGRMMLLGVGP